MGAMNLYLPGVSTVSELKQSLPRTPVARSPCQCLSPDRSHSRNTPGRAEQRFWQRPRQFSAFPSLFPLALAFLMPGTNPRGNQAALQLSSGTEDSKGHLTGGRARIHLFREGNEVDPEGLERFQGTKQMRRRPGEAVKLPNRDGVETSPVGIRLPPLGQAFDV